MESSVEEVKKKLDIVEIISKYLPLKKRGRHYLTNCPFHGEKTPSFTVSPELQIFKCFGCGKSGDIFTFVQEYEHVDFRDALQDLAKLAGVTLKQDPRLSQAEKRHSRLILLNQEAAKFYHYLLLSHPLGKKALEYLANRQISPETIKLFRLGFSPSHPDLTVNYLLKKGFTKDELIASGTFGTSRYGNNLYDRFANRLVFPLADFRDRILGFSGRALPNSPSNFAKYINSPETDIYHKSSQVFGLNRAKEFIKSAGAVIIVEGEFDMITPFQNGIGHIVAIKGTAFTHEQLELLHRYTDTLVLCLDSDFAGTNASLKSIESADALGFDIQVVDLDGRFKDPDEAVLADPDFFRDRLTHPIPVWDFIISSSLKKNDSSTPKGKQQILREVLPFISKIANLVTRSDYLTKLANYLGSDPSALAAEFQKYLRPSPSTSPIVATPTAVVSVPKVESLESHLLSLILAAKKPVLLATKVGEQIKFSTPKYLKIFSLLGSLPDTNFVPSEFSLSLPPELRPAFEDIYIRSTTFDFDSHGRLIEINKTISQILTLNLKSELQQISQKIAQAESQNQEDVVKKLEVDYNHLLSELALVQTTKR